MKFTFFFFTLFLLNTTAFALESSRSEISQPQVSLAQARAQKKVQVFVTSWCAYCRALEEFLKQNKISYERLDIEKNEQGRRLYMMLGGTGSVPLVRVGDNVLRGYDPAGILEALQKR